jgi:Fibrobacter succinogenes major domain (Fib_succ_major).
MALPGVKIGKQIWMIKNLDVAEFRNGELIPEARSNEEWIKAGMQKKPAWCYHNDPELGKRYCKLYNWYAVSDQRGLAPEGWHIPTQKEFEVLQTEVNNSRDSLLAVWQLTGNNRSGFSALLAGLRYSCNGYFGYPGYDTAFWSYNEYDAESAFGMYLTSFSSDVNLYYDGKAYGFSVRCIKNSPVKTAPYRGRIYKSAMLAL